MRRTHQAHSRCRAILLMVGVQQQQQVDGLGERRIGLVRFGRQPEGHAQEVLHQRERIVRVEQRLADGRLVRVRRDGRQLRQQPDGRQLELIGIERVEGILVERGQRRNRRGENGHRMCVARERAEEALELLVEQRVPADAGGEFGELRGRRQFAVDQQVAHLQVGRTFRQLLDRISAVAEDAGIAVDVGDGRGGRSRVRVTRIERDEAGGGHELGDIEPRDPFGGPRDRHLQRSVPVREGDRVRGVGRVCHACLAFSPVLDGHFMRALPYRRCLRAFITDVVHLIVRLVAVRRPWPSASVLLATAGSRRPHGLWRHRALLALEVAEH